jgi:hypothetical protein
MNDDVITGEVVRIPELRAPVDLVPTAETMLKAAHDLIVDCDDMEAIANESLHIIAGNLKRNEAFRAKLLEPFRMGTAMVNGWFKRPNEMYAEARQVTDGKILTYRRAKEEARRLEEARLAEERRKEEARIAAEAAAAAAEAEAKAEALRLQAEEQAAAGNAAEAARLAAYATAASASGREQVQDILEQATAIAVPVMLAPAVQKLDGTHERRTYGAALDPGREAEVLGWLLQHPEYIAGCIEFKKSGWDSLARTMKEQFNVPGMKLVRKTALATRAA